jgi:hypothetical protein
VSCGEAQGRVHSSNSSADALEEKAEHTALKRATKARSPRVGPLSVDDLERNIFVSVVNNFIKS